MSLVQVGEALDSDTAEIVTVERAGAGAYADGVYQAGAITTSKTLCSVQHPTPDDLQTLPEGERRQVVLKFISRQLIATGDDDAGTVSDVVLYGGERYKIIQSSDWTAHGYCRSFGVRVA